MSSLVFAIISIGIFHDIMKKIITCRIPTGIHPLNTSDEVFSGQNKQDPAERIALFDRGGRHMRADKRKELLQLAKASE